MQGRKVVVTGAGRDFGRTLAIKLAEAGAEVFLSARTGEGAHRTREEAAAHTDAPVHAFACDLSVPGSVREFAQQVGSRAGHVDLLVNNGAGWLEGPFELAADEDIWNTITSGAAGMALTAKHFLPLLRGSRRPDIVNMISSVALPNFTGSTAHEAFYAAKGAQARFADVLSARLRPEGIRVISLYPPDFRNIDPLSAEWDNASRESADVLTARSLLECILFAVGQPRDCFIRSFHFEESLPAPAKPSS